MQTHEQALIECKEENVNLRNKSTTFQRKVRSKEEIGLLKNFIGYSGERSRRIDQEKRYRFTSIEE